jgi:hypothetical protein
VGCTGLPVLKCVALVTAETFSVRQCSSPFAWLLSELPSPGHASGHESASAALLFDGSVEREFKFVAANVDRMRHCDHELVSVEQMPRIDEVMPTMSPSAPNRTACPAHSQ